MSPDYTRLLPAMLARKCAVQSPNHSTYCSSAMTKFVVALGLLGLSSVNRSGKHGTADRTQNNDPAAVHQPTMVSIPSRPPGTSMRLSASGMASNPVAQPMTSSWYTSCSVRMQERVPLADQLPAQFDQGDR